jgi:hypothetical protein
MSLDELKLPKEDLFKFTCRDGHDSPNYTFTWELTPEGAKILQRNEVRFPFMYVFAVEEIQPKKVESHQEGCGCGVCGGHNRLVIDALFCLHEGAGQIQFHRSGKFRIYAMVIWDTGRADPNWRSQRRYVLSNSKCYAEFILDETGGSPRYALQNVVEDAVDIGTSFFAKPPNPTFWWWANLWFDSEPANTCEYKNRLWFAPGLLVKVPTVGVYVLLRGIAMFGAFLGSILVGFRPSYVHWRPMFHAFSSTWGQMFDFGESEANWATRAKGANKDRGVFSIIIRIPLVWIGGPIGFYYLVRTILHHPWVYLIGTLVIILGLAIGFGLCYLVEYVKSRRKSIPLYYETIPIERPKKPRVPFKVRWLDAKGKLCLPFPE